MKMMPAEGTDAARLVCLQELLYCCCFFVVFGQEIRPRGADVVSRFGMNHTVSETVISNQEEMETGSDADYLVDGIIPK